MTVLERLRIKTGEDSEELLYDLLETAKYAILARRFPFADYPTDDDGNVVLESRYLDLQYRMALDLYNKIGAEGQISHSENGVSRAYESSWISAQLLEEVTPFVGTVS